MPEREGRPLFTGGEDPEPEPDLPEPLEPLLRTQGRYVPSPELQAAVEVALLLGQPLLLTGEPGTGKTTLAKAVARQMFAGRYLEMQVKSTSGRDDLLYRIDDVARFRDVQGHGDARPLSDYIEIRPFGEAIMRACGPDAPLLDRSGRSLTGREPFLDEALGPSRPQGAPTVRQLLPHVANWTGPERWVVLIDEIDKAPRDTPNDLLEEFDRLAFAIPELGLRVAPPPGSRIRPVVVVTSNSEKSLPHAFLRRCAYHHIPFPSGSDLREIITQRLGQLKMSETLLRELLGLFENLRAQMRNKPGTAELLQWLKRADEDEIFRTASNRGPRSIQLKRLVSIIAKENQDEIAVITALKTWSAGR